MYMRVFPHREFCMYSQYAFKDMRRKISVLCDPKKIYHKDLVHTAVCRACIMELVLEIL